MHPTSASDAHLADRAIELRVLKAAIIVFLVSLAAVFVSLTVAFGVFAIAYVVYKYTYFAERIGAFTTNDLELRHRRLELAVAAIGVTAVVALFAIEAMFPPDWTAGGFLSLPTFDLLDLGSLLADPAIVVAWIIVLAPVAAASYAGLQLRHRLLIGLDTDDAVIRATTWEAVARLPVYLVWIGVLTTGPIYAVWQPLVTLGGDAFGLTATTGGFSVLLGPSFPLVVAVGVAASVVVIGSYLVLQRWKYDDATIPEVFGHPGIAPPTQHTHWTNVAVPVAVFVLYTAGILIALDSLPVTDLRVALATVVAVIVGADYLGRTTTVTRSVSPRVEDAVDAVVTGFGVGFFVLAVLAVLLGSRGSFVSLAVTYPIVALPLTHLAHRFAGRYAVEDVGRFVDRIEADQDSVDETAADRLFAYSESTDETRRARAIEGLATLAAVSPYRRDDAINEFIEAIESDDPGIVRAGLRGLATVLEHDRSAATYDRLANAGTERLVVAHLTREDDATEARAVEAAARLFTRGLEADRSAIAEHGPVEDQLGTMLAVVDRHPDDTKVASAVVEYFARSWDASARAAGDPVGPTTAQRLLGGLLQVTARADEEAQFAAVLAVTGTPAAADADRVSLALDRLDSDSTLVRYLAAHVVRTSLDRHADRVDPTQLLPLLDDPAPEVREAGARTISAFAAVDPEGARRVLDRLILHLEDHAGAAGPPEGHVIRALAGMPVAGLLDHPTAATAVAAYVDGTVPVIAKPAAAVLSSIITRTPTVAEDDAVAAAIEAGLTSSNAAVREACLDAVVAIIDHSVAAGVRFADDLAENLAVSGPPGALAVVCLAELLKEVPERGVAMLPALAAGVTNLSPVDRQAVPFMVGGTSVSEVTVDILKRVLPLEPDGGEVLIEPLTDIATTADGVQLEGVLQLLAVLAAEFPTECRGAVSPAAAVLESDRVGIRLAAVRLLANVAATHPGAVEPFVDRLVVATDDDYQRVRAAALVALGNVSVAAPGVLEPDIHRIIGLLDDDSASVREQAADLIAVIANREPEIIEPAAETADRLRRLQRDPAVDIDVQRLQDAATAIQTGTATAAMEDAGGAEGLWTPETGDEMGASGDTKVFELGGDAFDEAFATGDDTDSEPAPTAGDVGDVDGLETEVQPEGGSEDDIEDLRTVVESEGDDGDDVEGLETVVESEEEPADASEVEDLQTVIDSEGESEDDEDVAAHDTVIGEPASDPSDPSSEGDANGDVDGLETVIDPGDEGSDDGDDGQPGVEGMDTVIESSEETSEAGDPGVEGMDTVIDAGAAEGDDAASDEVEDLETVIEPSDAEPAADQDAPAGEADLGDAETVIRSGDEAGENEDESPDVDDLETVIEPKDDTSDSDDADEEK